MDDAGTGEFKAFFWLNGYQDAHGNNPSIGEASRAPAR